MIKPLLNQYIILAVPFVPLISSIMIGFFGTKFSNNIIGRKFSHTVAIVSMVIVCIISFYILFIIKDGIVYQYTLYTWMKIAKLKFEIGFLIDNLSALMMCIVTFISLMVHIYTIGYMKDDEGYNRFFSYISLFTFSMLMLVMSNNFLQLFFGWEAVGVISYLLIGFWYKRPSAIKANMKAFLVNRIGDFSFILGIGLILSYSDSTNYNDVFLKSAELTDLTLPGTNWMLLTVICMCLFGGAMGKSAQFPLHVWLPDSMEGPTPISALIHAATMVTAGIFMVTRMSPLFELSDTVLSIMLIIGSITALLMGFLGMIQTDIKLVIAYSTLSQLGYMTSALGASAYSIAMFHLMTHAFFKALLFLAAGSVIIAMHHDQDMRNMGGLRKYMPITWITSLIGSLTLIGAPFFSGFYSKDSIITAISKSNLTGSTFAYFAVLFSVFVTAFYAFRMYFMVFHGKENFKKLNKFNECIAKNKLKLSSELIQKPNESPLIITLPLIILAIPSIMIGFFTISPILLGNFFKNAIIVNNSSHKAVEKLAIAFHDPITLVFHSIKTAPLWLALTGAIVAFYFYIINPRIPNWIKLKFNRIYVLLNNKYYLDKLNDLVFTNGFQLLGKILWIIGDKKIIDGYFINGSIKIINWSSKMTSLCQSGYIYHYAFMMIVGLMGFLFWFMPLPFFQ